MLQSILHDCLGWLVRVVPQEFDFGIDAFVEIVTGDGAVTGRFFGVQMKAGPSYTASQDEDGIVYKGERKHLNYYLNHPVPVVLVVGDPARGNCWFTRFDANETDSNGDTWHQSIPLHQRLDASARGTLEEIAGPFKDYSADLQEFWATNRVLANEVDVLVFVIDREDVEREDISNTVAFFQRLQVSSKLTRKTQRKVELRFAGYDDDARELWEVPEVRTWMRRLDQDVKYWFWFLNTLPASHGLLVVLFSLSSVTARGPGVEFVPPVQLAMFLMKNYERLNEIVARVGASKEQNRLISSEVVTYFKSPHTAA